MCIYCSFLRKRLRHRRFAWLRIGTLFAAAWVTASCGEQPRDPSATAEGEPAVTSGRDRVLARIGSRTITVGEYMDALAAEAPLVRMRFDSAERKKAFLDSLVRVELLAQEAERRGLDRDPEVLHRVKRALADKLLEQLRRDLVKPGAISDANALAYYGAHRDDYRQSTFEQVKQHIKNTLLEQQRTAAIKRYVDKLRRKATIEVTRPTPATDGFKREAAASQPHAKE